MLAWVGARRDHDPGGDQPRTHSSRPPRRRSRLAPAATQRGEQNQERVLGRRGHVDHVGLQPAHDGDQAVKRHLEGAERDVGQIPAPQQQVAVDRVPALQRLGGGIGVRGLAPGLEGSERRTA
jgi:hypothetical protein